MGLKDLKTSLKSLNYGNDRRGGGSSRQPYIVTDINNVDTDLNRIRLDNNGVSEMVNASVTDTIRIGKFFKDVPRGPLFLIKQVGLQLSNPQLEHKTNYNTNRSTRGNGLFGNVGNFVLNTANRILNEIGPTRVYNLGINSLAQIPLNGIGGHITRHGFLPVVDENSLYQNVVKNNNINNANRLVSLKDKLLDKPTFGGNQKLTNGIIGSLISLVSPLIGLNQKSTNTLFSIFKPEQFTINEYSGGPNSSLGIGKTTIRRYDFTRTETEGKTDQTNPYQQKSNISPVAAFAQGKGPHTYNEANTNDAAFTLPDYNNAVKYISPLNKKYEDIIKQVKDQKDKLSLVYKRNSSGEILPSSTKTPIYNNGHKTLTFKLPWNQITRERRVGSGLQDSINLTPLFSSTNQIKGDVVTLSDKTRHRIRDLVKFRIEAVDTDDPSGSVWMIFRAYLKGFSDSYNPEWSETKYAGRGEKFHIYNGFDRKISLTFKVAALSAEEMKPMYQKLNFLASNTMPDYNNSYMRGPIIKMTVGNYIISQPGIISSLTYTITDDTPWEIAIDEPEGGTSKKMYELPHIIEVNMTFTPIHNFMPQKGANFPIILDKLEESPDPKNPWLDELDPRKRGILKMK